MMTLDTRELLLIGDRVEIGVSVPLPVRSGTVDVCLATARTGGPAHPTLDRAMTATDGAVMSLTLFTRDLLAVWPRGGRAWLVVRYGPVVLAAGEVRLVVG